MEDNHSPTPTDNSILANDNLSKSGDQEQHKDVRKDHPSLLRSRRSRQRLLLIACVLVGLVMLGAAIAFARVNLEFRQSIFYPILANLVVLAIASVIGYLTTKKESE